MMLLFIIPSLIVFWICLDFIAKTQAGLAEIGLLLLDQTGQASIRSKLIYLGADAAASLHLGD
jgi:hypothetical protein